MPFIIKNLQASIEEKKILKGINLEVKQSEIHAIMGPNGSGKSTLANVLAGHPSYIVIPDVLAPPEAWDRESKTTVSLDNINILDMSPDERAKLGLFLAFQYPVEVPGVKINHFLWEAYKVRFGEKREFKKILDFYKYLEAEAAKLSLAKEMLSRGLNEGFSGGEKKRLEILQMNVLAPKYAILDETDSGLDVDAIKIVAQGIKDVVQKYKTGIIIITHYQRILDYVSPNFVHIVIDGKVTHSGGQELIEKVENKGYESLR